MKAHANGCAYMLMVLLMLTGSGSSQITGESSLANRGRANVSPATTLTRYEAKPGSKVRIEGLSTRSDWQVESKLIGGFLEVGLNFPTEPGQSAKPGKAEARAEAFVLIHSLKSIEKGGRPFSDEMDTILYGMLNARDDARAKITYHLTQLVLREIPKKNNEPYVFDSKGELAIAGVTNTVTMPLNVLPLGEKRLRISAATSIKMTDYKIQPPALTLSFGPLKTGDEVKLIFEWLVAEKVSPAAGVAK
jgi:hypothetical protein